MSLVSNFFSWLNVQEQKGLYFYNKQRKCYSNSEKPCFYVVLTKLCHYKFIYTKL